MTTYLKYYRRENERHADAEKVKGNFDQAVEMTKALFKHFRVKPIDIKLLDKSKKEYRRLRKVRSWYEGGNIFRKGKIVYHPTMLSVLTVAHEVAHYVDDVRAKQAKIRRIKWHSAAHRSLTDQGVGALKRDPRFAPLFANPGAVPVKKVDPQPCETEVATVSANKINEFYASLPEKLTCPCCNAHIPKRNFGVRVMKRDENGVPVVIRRQSYCKACR